MPVQLTQSQLVDIITAAGLTTIPQVMQHLSKQYTGLYDGKLAKSVATNLFK